MIKLNLKNTFGYLSIIVCLYLIFCYFQNTVSDKLRSTVIVQLMLTIICLFVILFGNRRLYINRTIGTGILLSTIISLSCFLDFQANIPFFNILGKAFLWILVVAAMFRFATKTKKKMILVLTSLFCLILMLSFLMSLEGYGEWVSSKDYTMTNVYYILCFLPFIIDIDSKWIKRIFTVLIFFCVFLSFKRSAIVISSVIIFTMILLFFKNEKKRNTALMLVIVFTIAIVTMPILLERTNMQSIYSMWLERFSDSNTRGTILLDVWNMQIESSFFEWIFGHGYNAVMNDIGYGLSAHNDYLEILYDYGLIAFVLFIVFIVSMIKYCKRLKKFDCKYYKGMIISLEIFIVASIPSHVYTYSTYFIILSLYWGYCMALSEECIGEQIQEDRRRKLYS